MEYCLGNSLGYCCSKVNIPVVQRLTFYSMLKVLGLLNNRTFTLVTNYTVLTDSDFKERL